MKPPGRPARGPLDQMVVGAPLDRMSTDIMGPLPLTPSENRYILVITDDFTKRVEVFAVPDYTAVTFARVILNEVIARFGCPVSIHSDQGTNYESSIFSELCRMLEIRKNKNFTRSS